MASCEGSRDERKGFENCTSVRERFRSLKSQIINLKRCRCVRRRMNFSRGCWKENTAVNFNVTREYECCFIV